MSGIRCERYMCGSQLVEREGRFGKITWACPSCDRNKRGLCRDCPDRLASLNAMRCRACAKRHKRAGQAASKRRIYRSSPRGRNRILANNRRSRRKPEILSRDRARQKGYRAEHPVERDAFTKTYFREYARQRRADPEKNNHDLQLRRDRYAANKSSTRTAAA
ncbi:MAG TPA: hypothetical protein VGN65_01330 [Casimicrobiaceae bacterium]|jgi:hypothetical protein